jgi:hypothetical protein
VVVGADVEPPDVIAPDDKDVRFSGLRFCHDSLPYRWPSTAIRS